MDNNDIMRRLRYALNINDQEMAVVFSHDKYNITPAEVNNLLKKEDEEGFTICSDEIITHFLDGLIIQKRGPRDPGKPEVKNTYLNNNTILKKLRIALEMKEEDMIATFTKGGFAISKPELTALFRKKGHVHYRDCGDQLMRRFLKGLSVK